MTGRIVTAKVAGGSVIVTRDDGRFTVNLELSTDDADALGDELTNCAMQLRYGGWPLREGVAGPMFDSYGRDPHSWNIDLEDDDQGSTLDEIRQRCADQGVTLAEAVAQNLPVARDVRSADVPPDDTSDPFASDGSGRPGASLVGGAIAVWSGLQRGRPSVATAAAVFNLSPAMIREAVEGQPYLYLDGNGDDASTFIEPDGE